ncbi:D-aminoacyl-tRNA deacylase [Flavimarina sp. Hel_I_48]|uniref:D-aminoacyl-tRNA deacylase n=1 Tax=Flavimarina sp. Hel_I_48 TaxID=1392488 RepID=UPI0004DF818A|nr:D-aminoacyl-tRNA deacylase [Flavimarina sp. Hel_I_48]
MRTIIQRVSKASVSIDGKVHAGIKSGFLVLLGIGHDDTEEDMDWLVRKICGLRIFSDADGLMNESILDQDGEILVISQFTLFASTKKGNRPSFLNSAKPEHAIPLYEMFINKLSDMLKKPVKTGIFGADMQVSLVNDGPVTISIDSKNRE